MKNTDQILDAEIEEPIVYNRFRPLAFILELVPSFIALLGMVANIPELTTVGFCTLAVIYFPLGFYIFKAEKFKIVDVLLSLFFGMGLATVVLPILFAVQDWPYQDEMLIVGTQTVFLCLFLSLIHTGIKMSKSSNKEFEFTMSLKILSRWIFYFLIYWIFGLNQAFFDLFA